MGSIPCILESNPALVFADFLNEKKGYFAVLIRTFPSTTPCAQLLQKSRAWVSAAWKAIPESIIVRSFKKCYISNALDGSEDDILWEDDGEDKDDSDWVTDNDSVMSDDGESDE